MTDTFEFDDENDEANQKMATVPRKVIRKLEKEAAEGKEAKAELAQIKQRQVFVEAGVDLSHPAADYFVRGYSGEVKPEVIQSEWERVSGQTSNSGGNGQQHDNSADEELRLLQGGQQLTAGGGQPTHDKLAERDAKLAALSPSDPQYAQKFDMIAREYGTVYGDMVG